MSAFINILCLILVVFNLNILAKSEVTRTNHVQEHSESLTNLNSNLDISGINANETKTRSGPMSKTLLLPIDKPPNMSHSSDKLTTIASQAATKPEYVAEGGSLPIGSMDSATFVNTYHEEVENNDEESHSKGSKPRKGVDPPGSVVPRKGVNEKEAPPLNSTLISDKYPLQTSEETAKNSFSTGTGNTEGHKVSEHTEKSEKIAQKTYHVSKPEIVSDDADTDDFDQYPIIKTSTGEDYVILGIVIVIGIWFAVFGALIFYRRAGEYWDRRHYRRMDFLVEGMYND